jgi:hypothetical protein
MAMTPTNSFENTVAESLSGMDLKNRTLLSLRSAYRQSSRYQTQ